MIWIFLKHNNNLTYFPQIYAIKKELEKNKKWFSIIEKRSLLYLLNSVSDNDLDLYYFSV